MADKQERATGHSSDVRESMDAKEKVDETAASFGDSEAGAVEQGSGAVAALVGILTGGFAIAAAAGFVLGTVVGLTVGRRATPPPPWWQRWP